MPPERRGEKKNGEKEKKESMIDEGPVYTVSSHTYTLPFFRYVNIFRGVAIVNGLLSIILWLCGGDTEYFEENIVHFKLTHSTFDIAVLALVKVLVLIPFTAALEEAAYKLIDFPFDRGFVRRATLLHTALRLIPFSCLAFGIVKGALVLYNIIHDPDYEKMSATYYAECVSFVVLTAVELVLGLWSGRAMRGLQSVRILHQYNESGQELNKDGRVIRKSPGILKLFSLAKTEVPLLLGGMGAMLISSGSQIVAPLFFGKVVDAALKSMEDLNRTVLILLGVYICGSIAGMIRAWLFVLAGQRMVARLRKNLFTAVVRQDIAFFDVTRTGELCNRLASDTQVLQNAVTVNISMLARYLLQIIGSVVFMFILNASLSGILLAVVPIVSFSAVRYGKFVQKKRKEFQDCTILYHTHYLILILTVVFQASLSRRSARSSRTVWQTTGLYHTLPHTLPHPHPHSHGRVSGKFVQKKRKFVQKKRKEFQDCLDEAGIVPYLTTHTLPHPHPHSHGRVSGKFVQKKRKEFQDCLADASTQAEEALSSMRTVRMFSGEGKVNHLYGKEVDRSYRVGSKLALAQGAFDGIIGTLTYGSVSLVLWYGGKLVNEGTLSAGILTSFLLYTLQVALAFGLLSSLYGDFMQAVGASIRIFFLLERLPDMPAEDGTVLNDLRGAMEFRSVTFTYPSRLERPVLKGLSFKVEPGEMVALVGPSGGGKSTIVSLIERFYDPDSGIIYLDGHDLKSLDAQWFRRKIGMVSQEPTLFAFSIRDNIAYGCEASDEEVTEAAKQANAHTFIRQFEEGYGTMVGERGVRLSGGQKQRIAIARALIMNPTVLLLDEATSALDAESEHLVKEAIDRAMKGRTVIVIAHRLSTVRNASKVIVIDQGTIAEMGTHDDLLAKNGVYKRLVLRQLESGSVQGDSLQGMTQIPHSMNSVHVDFLEESTEEPDMACDAASGAMRGSIQDDKVSPVV
ncbi:hypothetical protein ACOMHN_013422 [Nucella lapillus]